MHGRLQCFCSLPPLWAPVNTQVPKALNQNKTKEVDLNPYDWAIHRVIFYISHSQSKQHNTYIILRLKIISNASRPPRSLKRCKVPFLSSTCSSRSGSTRRGGVWCSIRAGSASCVGITSRGLTAPKCGKGWVDGRLDVFKLGIISDDLVKEKFVSLTTCRSN